MTVALWLLALATTMRLTRLIAQDTFPPSAWFRAQIGGRFGYDHAAYDLVTCVWCASWWIGAAVFPAAHWAAGLWPGADPGLLACLWVGSALTWSLITGMVLSQFTPED